VSCSWWTLRSQSDGHAGWRLGHGRTDLVSHKDLVTHIYRDIFQTGEAGPVCCGPAALSVASPVAAQRAGGVQAAPHSVDQELTKDPGLVSPLRTRTKLLKPEGPVAAKAGVRSRLGSGPSPEWTQKVLVCFWSNPGLCWPHTHHWGLGNLFAFGAWRGHSAGKEELFISRTANP
jgi:hypothetical protein